MEPVFGRANSLVNGIIEALVERLKMRGEALKLLREISHELRRRLVHAELELLEMHVTRVWKGDGLP